MRYLILATDYDGTLALHGMVNPTTIASIKKAKASGRKIILVTGRELEELQQLFPDYALFDLIVAENGALIFEPATKYEFTLGDKPPVSLKFLVEDYIGHLLHHLGQITGNDTVQESTSQLITGYTTE